LVGAYFLYGTFAGNCCGLFNDLAGGLFKRERFSIKIIIIYLPVITLKWNLLFNYKNDCKRSAASFQRSAFTGMILFLYSSQCGFEISPLNPLFLREDLGEFIKEKNLKTTFILVYNN